MHDTILTVDDSIRLRAWRPGDLPSLLRHADDAEVSRGTSDRFPFPYTRQDGQAFLSGRVLDLSGPVFAIELDGEACGGIGASRFAGERAVGAEVGYWLGRAHWGRGIMSRVLGTFAPWLMRDAGLVRLQAGVLDFNVGSARVLEKNGFVEEGRLRCAVRKRGCLHDLRIFGLVDAGSARQA